MQDSNGLLYLVGMLCVVAYDAYSLSGWVRLPRDLGPAPGPYLDLCAVMAVSVAMGAALASEQPAWPPWYWVMLFCAVASPLGWWAVAPAVRRRRGRAGRIS